MTVKQQGQVIVRMPDGDVVPVIIGGPARCNIVSAPCLAIVNEVLPKVITEIMALRKLPLRFRRIHNGNRRPAILGNFRRELSVVIGKGNVKQLALCVAPKLQFPAFFHEIKQLHPSLQDVLRRPILLLRHLDF